jgi:hypothetical protein
VSCHKIYAKQSPCPTLTSADTHICKKIIIIFEKAIRHAHLMSSTTSTFGPHKIHKIDSVGKFKMFLIIFILKRNWVEFLGGVGGWWDGHGSRGPGWCENFQYFSHPLQAILLIYYNSSSSHISVHTNFLHHHAKWNFNVVGLVCVESMSMSYT